MPIYCFKTDDGEVVERSFHVDRVPKRVRLPDGRRAKRSLVDELRTTAVSSTKGWPLTCIASGVHASQAGELRDHLAAKGVPTEVTSDGDPIYRNASHRRKALAVRGMHDRASFC